MSEWPISTRVSDIKEHGLRYFDETFISTEAFGKGEELKGMIQRLKGFLDLK